MISKNVQQMIPVIRQYLSDKPVERAYLFGSCSRGEETADSDIDLLVNYTDDSLSLFAISRLMVGLSKQLNRRVDLVEESGLRDFARPSAEKDKILIYEREPA
ncbi:MAG: nucleotidyltransferase domain-containing protein [Paludibacteraceae bacterium]|nr:nucleotidyltransferase domain-containing protein [Paludibacteraceae bacterium]